MSVSQARPHFVYALLVESEPVNVNEVTVAASSSPSVDSDGDAEIRAATPPDQPTPLDQGTTCLSLR